MRISNVYVNLFSFASKISKGYHRTNNSLLLTQFFYVIILLINCSNNKTKYFFINSCIVIGPEQLEQSLCKSKVCPNYGKCKIDENEFYAKCVCPDECDITDFTSAPQMFMINDDTNSLNYKSREVLANELFSQTVCGSDGRDYENFCELKKESCRLNREIKIFYFGKCSKIILFKIYSIRQ